MSSPPHEDEVAETVPSILSGHEHQTFFLRGPTPDPDRLATQHYENVVPGTRRDSTLTVTYKAADWNFRLKRKMEGKWVEVPFSELVKLVPGREPSTAQINRLVKCFNTDDFKHITEPEMYPILCTAFNAVNAAARSNSLFKDVADNRQNVFIDIRPDLVMYSKQPKLRSIYTLDKAALRVSDAPEERKMHLAKCNWSLIQVFVECKNKEVNSAFHFSNKKKFLRTSKEGERAQAQIAKYASEIQLRQHRTHVWSLYFAGPYVRVQRWDRSGCMVSTAINFQQDTVEMVNFLFKLARLTPEQLGYDTTAVLATPKEIKMISAYTTDNPWLERYRQHMLFNQIGYPIYKVVVPTYVDFPVASTTHKRRTRAGTRAKAIDSRKTEPRTYLIGQPIDCHSSPVGRATKGYIGLDMQSCQLVFIKDQWRSVAPGAHLELETYERLRKNNVCAVATCLGGGDVASEAGDIQRTLSYKLLPGDIGIDNSERYHTRLILKDIGRPLHQYPSSYELIAVLYHALVAHSEAWEYAEVLHRDMSPGNIMINVESPDESLTGFLTDWDMCKYKEDLDNHLPALPGRSGTWSYLSVLALQYPKKPQELADDLESSVYILFQMALRFHKHHMSPTFDKTGNHRTPDDIRKANGTNDELAGFIRTFFEDQFACEDGYWSGGNTKRVCLEANTLPAKLTHGPDGKDTPLCTLLRSLYGLLREHYGAINYKELERFTVLKKIDGSEDKDADERALVPVPPSKISRSKVDPPKQGVPATMRLKSRRANRKLAEGLPVQPPAEGLNIAQPTAESSQPEVTPDHIVVHTVKNPKRVLDNHEAILKVFERVLESSVDWSRYKHDKWYDQFDGLSAANLGAPDKEPSKSSKTGNGKRKPVELEYDAAFLQFEPPELKRVKGDTFRAHALDSVVEEAEEDDEAEEEYEAGEEYEAEEET